MKSVDILLMVITILSFSTTILSAQESNWRLIKISGDTLNECKLDSLPEIVLFTSCSGRAISIPIDSISILEGLKVGSFMKGAAIGIPFGIVAGIIIGYASYHKPENNNFLTLDFGPGANVLGGGLIGGASGFLVGGIIGASSGHYETYDLRAVNTLRLKRQILLQAF